MDIDNLTDLATDLTGRAQNVRFDLKGPVTIDYGYGWSTTLSFWSADRRVHFYFEGEFGRIYVVAEAAEVGPPRRVAISRIQTADEAWSILARFLRNRCAFEDLPGHEWLADVPETHDQQIPHPPVAPKAEDFQPPPKGPPKAAAPKTELVTPPPTPVPAAAKITGIGAVMLYSNDPARLAKWYRDTLGLTLQEQEGRFYGAAGGAQFGIFPSQTPIPDGPRTTMVDYSVSNFDSFVADLVGRGAELLALDETKLGKFAHTRDADGNPIEIWGPPQG